MNRLHHLLDRRQHRRESVQVGCGIARQRSWIRSPSGSKNLVDHRTVFQRKVDVTLSGNTRRWLGLIAIALCVALIGVYATIVNVITPSIIDDLGIDSSQAQWMQESYEIAFAALLPS
ncbi:MFS transporter [Gordonia otitidis]|nr:MFS transporter [Gordonia otitidis]